MLQSFLEDFINNLKQTGIAEFIAVIAGIASVWFSKKENVLVYPVGLINTIIYIWLSYKYHLLGESVVNLYYTIMSIYGWYLWSRKNQDKRPAILIRRSTGKEWRIQIFFFTAFYITVYITLTLLRQSFYPGAIPPGDAFATASAFTGMWLMAKKKVESWYWWIATNIASVPLFYIKGLALTSVYYFILLLLAISGLAEWKRKAGSNERPVIHGMR